MPYPDEGARDLVYHSEMTIGGRRIILSDEVGEKTEQGNPLSLVVTFETAGEVKKAYEILSQGAQIVHAMQSTSYSSCFVSLIDQYGIRWELMTEQTER